MRPNRWVLLSAAWLLFGSTSLAQNQRDAQITDGYTTIHSDIRIHYLEAGKASSAPELILIPGWRLPAFLWNKQLHHFSQTTRVIAIDPRSQGESSKTTEGNTPESRAADLHDILANLHVTRCVLVGWSQGAQDVAAYLQQFGGDFVAGVVFVDSPVSFGPAEVELHKEFSKIILSNVATYTNHPAEFSHGMVQCLFKKPHPELDMAAIVKSTLQTPTDTGASMLVMDIFGADRRPALTKLSKPALVIASSASPLLDVQKEMAATIPGSKLVLVEGAGHAVFVDDPQKFEDELGTFIQALSR